MKASMYISYPARSLLRGGSRTILAVFCVTVGVMAVVALQLVGFMLQQSLASSARDANGGDILVTAQGAPLKAADLAFFDQLKSAGNITNYTAITQESGALTNASSATRTFTLEAIDPNNYPLLSQPSFAMPATGSIAQMLSHNQVIVTQHFLTTYGKQFHDTFTVYVKTATGSGQTLTVGIAGVIANTGMFAQAGNLLLISSHDYLASAPSAALANYTLVQITTADQAHTDTTVKAINAKFPLANTQTATDLLKAQQSSIDQLNTFLKIAGLIALLIGGVGIVNTMQVLLSRRRTEIAMLKTAGYHRRDLYLLFGIETGLLGLIGGIAGAAAALGVSFLIRGLMESLGSNVPFALSYGILIGGVAIGFVTALIFGLLPIVQAANIRPLHVLRGIESGNSGGRFLTILLLVIFSILFCTLAIVILDNNILLGVLVTYGTFAVLALLSGLFSLIVLALSKLPVPERMRFSNLLPGLVGIALTVPVLLLAPVFGAFLLVIVLLGLAVVCVPGHWKINVKMALRNLGRQRGRTTTTLLALFIGVYGIGLDIGIGQDFKTLITNALAQNAPYNLVATTTGGDSATLHARLSTIPGLSASREDPFTVTLPLTINGRPTQGQLPAGDYGQQVRGMLGGLEGYDLAHTLPTQAIIGGRNLTAADASTNNIIVSGIMTSKGWASMNLKVGDTVTFASLDHKTVKTASIVGIISITASFQTLGRVIAPASFVNSLSAATSDSTTVFYMKVPSGQVDQALSILSRIVPNASVQNLSDSATSFLQQISSFLDVLLAVAALSMLAGVVIIANSVALAMLERRRELGILKAVGYTSRTILSQVLIENGITGGIGAFIATLLAAAGVALGSTFFFSGKLTLNMEPVVVASLVIAPTLLAIITAIVVAWNAVRVRPLVVLKYE